MNNLIKKAADKTGKFIAKKTGIEGLRKASDKFDEVYTEIFGIKTLNRGEEGTVSRKQKIHPLKKCVSSWTDEDLNEIMQSNEYKYDTKTQNKVKNYFDYKYPGNQKLDATGRPIHN